MPVTGKGFKTEVASTVPVDDTNLNFPADNVQEALEQQNQQVAVSASPGFSLGQSGNVNTNSWLNRVGNIPSNITGLPVRLYNAKVVGLSVGCENADTFDVSVYEHEGDEINLTLIGTVSVVTSRTETFTVDWTVTTGRQLAARLTAGSGKNVGVDMQLSGSVTP